MLVSGVQESGSDTRTPGGTMIKNPPPNAEDLRDVGSIPGSGRSPDWDKYTEKLAFWVDDCQLSVGF